MGTAAGSPLNCYGVELFQTPKSPITDAQILFKDAMDFMLICIVTSENPHIKEDFENCRN